MAYATLQEIRDEGVTAAQADDARVNRLLDLATVFVDKFTGRFFEPRNLFLTVDGRGSRSQLLNMPVIAVTMIRIDVGPFAPGFVEVDLDLVRIYNRHLTQGLLNPDDRENPRITFFHGHDLHGVPHRRPLHHISLTDLIFPHGQQNITIEGTFGYTDPDLRNRPFTANPTTDVLTSVGHGFVDGVRVRVRNEGGALPEGLEPRVDHFVVSAGTDTLKLSLTKGGSPVDITDAGTGSQILSGDLNGFTPTPINHATKLLVLREVPRLDSTDAREDAIKRWRLAEEKTRDQSYKLGGLHLKGVLTGDPDIDSILVAYKRPANFGAA